MRRAAKVDNSHAEIYRTLHQCGITVVDVSKLPNLCDMMVLFRGRAHFIEAKTAQYASVHERQNRHALLTRGERLFAERCEQNGIPYHIVFNADECLRAIGAAEEID